MAALLRRTGAKSLPNAGEIRCLQCGNALDRRRLGRCCISGPADRSNVASMVGRGLRTARASRPVYPDHSDNHVGSASSRYPRRARQGEKKLALRRLEAPLPQIHQMQVLKPPKMRCPADIRPVRIRCIPWRADQLTSRSASKAANTEGSRCSSRNSNGFRKPADTSRLDHTSSRKSSATSRHTAGTHCRRLRHRRQHSPGSDRGKSPGRGRNTAKVPHEAPQSHQWQLVGTFD
jgi:hypothetical protein